MDSNDIYVSLTMETEMLSPLPYHFNPNMPCVTNKLLQCSLKF